MPKQKLDPETRAAIAAAYLDGDKSRKEVAEEFGVSEPTVTRCVRAYKEGITLEEATAKHHSVMKQKKAEHTSKTPWMEHVTPLHKQKLELEEKITRKQAELDAARQEYRDFLATLRQLMEEQA